ncbi:hypothetical protein [Cohnella hashimotonis]|uniref:Uncharacterized protein n=1 Tax=Cohnella hashimotonis TaxID=2826895 RepID=A0ABT6TMD7_9BACL|nr:hypothetical protein [Cohnella hashimotonis]MDI4647485.1 hypothetical protein [Cohnella hashimotonis]
MKWDTGLIANIGPGRMAGMVITAANPSANYANVLLETYTRTGDSGPMTVYAQHLFTVTNSSIEAYAFAGFDLVGIRAVAAGPGSNGVALSVRAYNAEGGSAGQFMVPVVFAEPTYLYLSLENEAGIVMVESDLRSFAAYIPTAAPRAVFADMLAGGDLYAADDGRLLRIEPATGELLGSLTQPAGVLRMAGDPYGDRMISVYPASALIYEASTSYLLYSLEGYDVVTAILPGRIALTTPLTSVFIPNWGNIIVPGHVDIYDTQSGIKVDTEPGFPIPPDTHLGLGEQGIPVIAFNPYIDLPLEGAANPPNNQYVAVSEHLLTRYGRGGTFSTYFPQLTRKMALCPEAGACYILLDTGEIAKVDVTSMAILDTFYPGFAAADLFAAAGGSP